jgi:hypothetical protein
VHVLEGDHVSSNSYSAAYLVTKSSGTGESVSFSAQYMFCGMQAELVNKILVVIWP